MKLPMWTIIEWFKFFSKKENTTEVECYSDYEIANNIMRKWLYDDDAETR